MFDCHVHSSFSGDSDMEAIAACDKALELGLAGIAFTDHLDFDYPDFSEKFNIDFDKYSACINSIKSRYNGRLEVLKGIETGIQPHVIEKTGNIVKSYDFDFVIASIHVVGRVDPYLPEYYEGKTKEEAFGRYLEEILFAAENFKDYNVIGHIGYVRRYCNYNDRTLRYVDFCDILDEILKTVIKDGKGIEVNTSGYRNGLCSPIPDYDIVKRYKELGGEIICLGSDAHCTEHIAANFEKAKQHLIASGFRHLAHFVKRQPVFEKI